MPPLLFLLIVEGLRSMTLKAKQVGHIKGINIIKLASITHPFLWLMWCYLEMDP